MPPTSVAPIHIFDAEEDDDEDGWEDMPVVRDEISGGLDEEDKKKYHYMPSAKGASAANATGQLIDVDDMGNEWRSKVEQNENDYTRLRVNEEEDADEVHLRTKYLFDEDKAMTPLSQMQATKGLLTEAQRVAYVGVCALVLQEMAHMLKAARRKELKPSITSMELWSLKIMGRLYYHMELETQEQKMIESLAEHGVQAMDLVPALMTTHTVNNPEYDPSEALRLETEKDETESLSGETIVASTQQDSKSPSTSPQQEHYQTTARVLETTATSTIPGVSTSLSSADEKVTLDIRWTVLCDLFLILIADSVYDARSRVLLENVALKLGLGWIDVVKFESRVTEALEIQEDVERLENQDVIEGTIKANKKKRYMMLGLATLGGGLVIGLSAGLLAPVIGLGLGAAFGTIGITGTTGFLAGAGGAAVITTGGVLTGSGIAVKGMINRTQQVKTFQLLPLHNNKRVSCIITVPGFLNGIHDDPRLPFSVLDPIVGDVFSVLWEPEMIRETGSALSILTGEVLSSIGQTVLSATVMTALMSALQWPIILTKLGYLIDNPWNNALDRARAAGGVLAEVLIQRHLGVRPITLIGFSLGARVIFYALVELARKKAFGIVQDVFLMGTTLTASQKTWCETRSVVSGRYVNAYAKNDWVLNYLFRATSGGVGTVAGLRPVEGVPGLENVDVTDKISGHLSYRTFMPLILDQLGFPVFADYFDEPEEPDFEEERIVVREAEGPKKKGWFTKTKANPPPKPVSRPPSSATFSKPRAPSLDDDLPPRLDTSSPVNLDEHTSSAPQAQVKDTLPTHAGFDFGAIKEILGKAETNPEETQIPTPHYAAPTIPPPTNRSVSMPPPVQPQETANTKRLATPPPPMTVSTPKARSVSLHSSDAEDSWEPPSSSLQNMSVSSSRYPPSYEDPVNLPFGSRDDSTSWASPIDRSPYTIPSFSASTAPLSSNPFSVSSSGLSFGGADGSITEIAEPDPWTVPSFDKKKNTGFNSNPWS